jgi:hypothetical protein
LYYIIVLQLYYSAILCMFHRNFLLHIFPVISLTHNIRLDLGEVGWGGVDWIGLTQDKDKWRTLVNAVMNLRVP